MDLLQYDFLQRALIAAAVVGLVTPLIGVFLVQRRLALLGDGMGHVALAGVGLAFLFGTAPVPTALVAAACGAVIIELIRAKSRTAGDLALALIFYGGIAGGVLFTSLAGGRSSAALNQYLFGSLSTVSATDLVWLGVVAVIVLVVLAVFGRDIFVLALDPDLARTQGIRTTATSMLLTVLAALAVVIGMRTVGLLLVSAIMIVPVAAAQQLSRSFRGTAALGVVVGELSAVLGLVASFQLDVPPGPAIVVLALLFFGACAAVAVPLRRRRSRRVAAARPAVLHEEVAA
ncbi:MAG: metal ABC transporter permease [Candidatus Nanopelagicales bacterium]|jgi:zinc transport system permease protein|nr:metal ABC transporter permease [Actinomycetota bacterium]